MSFRFSEEGLTHLKALSKLLNMTQIEVLENLLEQEFQVKKKTNSRELKEALDTVDKLKRRK